MERPSGVFGSCLRAPWRAGGLTDVPITVPKAQCDLTGVVVLYGSTGVTVPSAGGVEANADGISSPSSSARTLTRLQETSPLMDRCHDRGGSRQNSRPSGSAITTASPRPLSIRVAPSETRRSSSDC